MSALAIKSMTLYAEVDRVYNDLRAAGIDDNAPIPVETLCQFDQYHYHGTKAVDEAIRFAEIGPESKILDIGAGIGGPARYIAHKTGCQVVALELQKDLNDVGQDLTKRCGLADHVAHLCGDALDAPFELGAFDAVVSWLCLYHIPNHPLLFSQLARALKPGGKLYAEDLFKLGDFTMDERRELATMVYGQSVLEQEDYKSNLINAGFADIGFEHQTDDWSFFVRNRKEAHDANFEAYASRHSQQMAEDIKVFYDTMDRLFAGGNLGGVKLTATKG